MSKTEKAISSSDDWDARKLGGDEQYVKRAPKSHEEALENALELHMISVRLQRQLIDDLKFISTAHGIGYQPLIRDILTRFVTHEKKSIIREAVARHKLEREKKDLDAAAGESAPAESIVAEEPQKQLKRKTA